MSGKSAVEVYINSNASESLLQNDTQNSNEVVKISSNYSMVSVELNRQHDLTEINIVNCGVLQEKYWEQCQGLFIKCVVLSKYFTL